MAEGAAMFAPEKEDLFLPTIGGEVIIPAGCKAIVHVKEGVIAVLNLHDKRAGQICVRRSGNLISTSMGKEIVISDLPSAEFATSNPAPDVAVRNLKSWQLSSGQRVFMADFSMISALSNHPALKCLGQSHSAEHRKQMKQLLKNAAALTYVTAKHGLYKQY